MILPKHLDSMRAMSIKCVSKQIRDICYHLKGYAQAQPEETQEIVSLIAIEILRSILIEYEPVTVLKDLAEQALSSQYEGSEKNSRIHIEVLMFHFLKKFHLNGAYHYDFTHGYFSKHLARMSNLRSLKLTNATVAGDVLKVIGHTCFEIEILEIGLCLGSWSTINAGLRSLKKCKKLRNINFSRFIEQYFNASVELILNLPNLQVFHHGRMGSLLKSLDDQQLKKSPLMLNYFKDDDAWDVCVLTMEKLCPKLKKVHISSFHVQIVDILYDLAESALDLNDITLEYIEWDDGVKYFLKKKGTNIKKLQLSFDDRFNVELTCPDAEDIRFIGETCPNIEYLEINGFSGELFSRVQMSEVKKLNLFKKLKHASLHHWDDFLAHSALSLLLCSATRIEYLNLEVKNGSHLNETFFQLFNFNGFSKLHTLTFYPSSFLSTTIAQRFALECPNLKHLNLKKDNFDDKPFIV